MAGGEATKKRGHGLTAPPPAEAPTPEGVANEEEMAAEEEEQRT
eukprot:CAMPEP_0197603876 /NCGR_PEP_ID=MMETSP1326-20131121/40064_1 /TAXON_ID=1155430 /ORGANISM="Genus nov. species nov., Strain RCC2288" /LENGTH=43 /DNA_ID= /DNA_START= /DNA_END= /DNA_ORIENTATION=